MFEFSNFLVRMLACAENLKKNAFLIMKTYPQKFYFS